VNPPLVVGSAARDVTADDPRGWRLGGAAAFCGLTLARLGLRPRVLLGVDAATVDATELGLLRDAGADLRLVPLAAGPAFRNRVTPEGRIQDCLEPGMPLEPVLPAGWGESEAWLLVPVADELGVAWGALPPPTALVAVGWQGLLRNLPRGGVVTRRVPSASPIISRADIVCLSREDVDPATSPAWLAGLLSPGATLILTDGPAGGTFWSRDADGRYERRPYPAMAAEALVDPTGAGDAFLAAIVAARLGHPLASGTGPPDLARLAAAVASLTVERPGLDGVPGLSAVAARLARDRPPGQDGEPPATGADPG
jgi:sugar/nucleoside kinase (ribokinase family)